MASKGKTVVSVSEDSPVIKGNLDDILQAIDIEETPIVQADFIGVDEHKQKRARKHSIEKTEFKRMKALWEGQTGSRFETPRSVEQLFTWTVPSIKEAEFVRVINTHLRASNRRLRDEVEDLLQQLKLTQDELMNKGAE